MGNEEELLLLLHVHNKCLFLQEMLPQMVRQWPNLLSDTVFDSFWYGVMHISYFLSPFRVVGVGSFSASLLWRRGGYSWEEGVEDVVASGGQ